MFRARGTKVIFDDVATVPAPAPPRERPAPKQPDPVENLPLGNFGVGPAMLVLDEVRADNDEDAAELAAMMGMGMPALPPDFRDQLRRAQAGDLDAIALMRAIGEQVPEHMRTAFMEIVHDALADQSA